MTVRVHLREGCPQLLLSLSSPEVRRKTSPKLWRRESVHLDIHLDSADLYPKQSVQQACIDLGRTRLAS